jgi:hypothetical protein
MANFFHNSPESYRYLLDIVAAGVSTEIMETADHTAIYPPSFLQHVNSLIIPANTEAYTAEYSCGRRCTFGPLGGLSGKPVNIAGCTFHGHMFMTGQECRCHLVLLTCQHVMMT